MMQIGITVPVTFCLFLLNFITFFTSLRIISNLLLTFASNLNKNDDVMMAITIIGHQ